MNTRILKEKNNVRLVEVTNSFGNVSYQVNTPETAEYAASLAYTGSDLIKAREVFAKEVGPKRR
ncbi:MAG: hypothetical protein EBR82_28560 [Caulobacteraceae bacterium]|nr:hypothetical protein [Caulobacteraceae bacterium]